MKCGTVKNEKYLSKKEREIFIKKKITVEDEHCREVALE